MRPNVAGLLLTLVVAGSVSAQPNDSAERAAQAAERAAQAAERSAAAAERAAAALERATPPLPPLAPPTPPPPPPPAAPPANLWTFNAGLGLISLTGNARTLTLTANAATQYKTEKLILNMKANGAYGQNVTIGTNDPPQVIALSALFAAQADYRFSERVSGYLGSGVDTDHVKSVEIRGYGEIGVGILWIDVKEKDYQRTLLTTDIGFRYQRENRFQYFPTVLDVPDVDLIAPRAAGSFRYALNREVFFQQDVEVLPNILGQSRVLVNTLSKVSARIIAVLSIGVSFAVKYDSRPAAGRVPTDTALTVGLEAAM